MKYSKALVACYLLASLCGFIAFSQADVTIAVIHAWWQVNHAPQDFFVVFHWWTKYTIASAMFMPIWTVCIGFTILLANHRPKLGAFVLVGCLVLEAASWLGLPFFSNGAEFLVGTEELPISSGEREWNAEYLDRLDRRLMIWGTDHAHFPLDEAELEDALVLEQPMNSPYRLNGKLLSYKILLIRNNGSVSTQTGNQPGTFNYAVNEAGNGFALSMSGLNMPVSGKISMMRASEFIGGKQPFNGLLAVREVLRTR